MNKPKMYAWVVALTSVFSMSHPLEAATTAQDTVLLPSKDPFYTPPANYGNFANGTVLSSRKINVQVLTPLFTSNITSQYGAALSTILPTLTALKNLKVNAYQVLYKSTDGKGNAVAEAATILVPQGPWVGKGTRPLVSYQLAEDSVSTDCQPSHLLRAGLLTGGNSVGSIANLEIPFSLLPLTQGHAMVYPDYEGPQSQWLAGPQAGHAVLDGIRAALNFKDAGLYTDTKVGLWGYSGGGGATGWAAALKSTYADELNVVGAAIGANANADLVSVYKRNNGKPVVSGMMLMAFIGLDRTSPEAGLQGYLNEDGKKLFAKSQNLCTLQSVAKSPTIGSMEKYTIAPNVSGLDAEPIKTLIKDNSLINQDLKPSMPVLSYHDQWDDLVPVHADSNLVKKWCQAGTSVQVLRTSTPVPFIALVHIAAEVEGWLPAMNYLNRRFNEKTPRNDCDKADQWDAKPSLFFPLADKVTYPLLIPIVGMPLTD